MMDGGWGQCGEGSGFRHLKKEFPFIYIQKVVVVFVELEFSLKFIHLTYMTRSTG